MYRKQDYEYLQNIYNRKSNDIIILYGDKRSGIFNLVDSFSKDKSSFYYCAANVDLNTQARLFADALNSIHKFPKYKESDFDSTISAYLDYDSEHKKVLIIDEYINIASNFSTFYNYILNLVTEKSKAGSLMIILCTYDIAYIETEVLKSNNFLYEISGLYKVNLLTYEEICYIYPNMNRFYRFTLYTCIGGSSELWDNLDINDSIQNYIVSNLLNKNPSIYDNHGILPDKIRQTTIYNSIMLCIANGHETLNELHNILNIDRAKLSVYIKTLVINNLLYKSTSYNIGNSNGYEKGVYKISDPYIHFYYNFIFPNISSLKKLKAEKFYKKFIDPSLYSHLKYYYPMSCRKNLMLLSDTNKLPFKISSTYNYDDKLNLIDFIALTNNNEVAICTCIYDAGNVSYKRYTQLTERADQIKINYDKVIIFSYSGFDNRLLRATQNNDNLILLSEKDT